MDGCKKVHTHYFLPSGTFSDSPRRGSALPRNESLPETPRGPQACCWAISCPTATVTPEPHTPSLKNTQKNVVLTLFFSPGCIHFACSQQKCRPAIEEKENYKKARGRREIMKQIHATRISTTSKKILTVHRPSHLTPIG